MDTNELSQYLQTLLSTATYVDYTYNGLQVAGTGHVQTICTAVTASLEAIHQAIEFDADALLVHHGFFWNGEPAPVVGIKKARLQALLKKNINLFAYHLPLDCHRELGNNAWIGRALQMKHVQQYPAGGTADLLWAGQRADSITPAAFLAQLTTCFNRTPQHLSGRSKHIQHVAWCSGGAQDFIEDAAAMGADAYISGEVSERTYYQAEELGIHYFACGHHATERGGIRTLGEHLAEKFQLNHCFIDSNNPC